MTAASRVVTPGQSHPAPTASIDGCLWVKARVVLGHAVFAGTAGPPQHRADS